MRFDTESATAQTSVFNASRRLQPSSCPGANLTSALSDCCDTSQFCRRIFLSGRRKYGLARDPA